MHAKLLVLLFLLPLAGCGQPSADPFVPQGRQAVHEFEASYSLGQYGLHMRLGPPASILDADLTLVEAYPLEIRLIDAPQPGHVVYWLSSDWRVIRQDDVCRVHPCPSTYAVVGWHARGYWPPLGFAANWLVANGVREQVQWGTQREVSPVIEGNTLRFRDGDNPEWLAGGAPFLPFAGSYTYHNEDPIPEAIAYGQLGSGTLTTLRLGPALPAVPQLRTIGTAATETPNGAWFPGSDKPLLGNSVSFDEAVENLSGQQLDFVQHKDTDCIHLNQAGFEYLKSQTAGLSVTDVRATPFSIETSTKGTTERRVWDWELHKSVAGETWETAPAEADTSLFNLDCTPGLLRVPVHHDAQAHIAQAATFPWDEGKQALFFNAQWNSEPLMGVTVPSLTLRYRTAFGNPETSSGFGFLSLAEEAPQGGLWFAFGGHPDELDRFEGAYGWPHPSA